MMTLSLALATVGCASTQPLVLHGPARPANDKSGEANDKSTVAPEGGACQIVRRGSGQVRDARLAQHWPDTNYGSAEAAFAGTVAGGERQTLIAFELPELPAGARITKARVSLNKYVCGGSGVEAHRVTRAWDESTVTWNSFDGAYEGEILTKLPSGEGGPGRVSLDVTSLARGWADGSIENDGILLRHGAGNTSFSTSESQDPSERPFLEICWTL